MLLKSLFREVPKPEIYKLHGGKEHDFYYFV
jgi:hypothetical protein